MWENKYSVDTG